MASPRTARSFLVIAACLVPGTTALAQGAKPADAKPAQAAAALPSAEEIQARFLEATGGKDKYEKVKFRVIRGKFEMASLNVTCNLEVWQGPDRKFLQSLDIPDVGKVDEGSDGELVWERGPAGTRILSDKERANALRDNDCMLELNLIDNYPLRDVAGIEKVGDHDAYKVNLLSKEGSMAERFYDVKSGLLVRSARNIQVQGTDLPTEALFEDYRDTDIGVKTPFRQRQRILKPAFKDRAAVLTIESIEYPETVDPAKFELPLEVRRYIASLKGEDLEEAKGRAKPANKPLNPPAPTEPPQVVKPPATPAPAPAPAPKP